MLPATENHTIAFHQIHLEDMGRVRTKKVCEIDGQELDRDDIGKGYELSKDTIVQVTDAELDAMPLPTAKAIEIVAFVPVDSIDPIRVGDGHYLAADGQVAAQPYTLLRQALERSSKVAVAKFAWHDRERLGLRRVVERARRRSPLTDALVEELCQEPTLGRLREALSVPVADLLPEREHSIPNEREDTARRWAKVHDGVDDAMDLVLEIADDEDAAHPRTKDDAVGCLLTEYCPPDSGPVYQGVLEPLFRLAEEVPFGISRIVAKG
ncbi:hypothetical protein GCM10010289_84650 [Streptomyces violascens]|uniref:Ku domain-containing protein n=1 Tax=Streptomyces violascens TaxID=67381 RepID=A0ABQ3QS38_9ACTN|nr:hypothetical protein GCM10010289_84650 [Streptomyces violascens]GHI40076.1 hypothetical protein Sviol_44840 [Streptomyces violascens]